MFKFGIPAPHRPAAALEVRDNFEALATTNATSRADEPVNPRNGMLRVYAPSESEVVSLQLFWNTWRTLTETGTGVVAAQRKDKDFVNETVWVFDHLLERYPLVQCVDTTNEVVHPLKIEHASVNRIVVTHSMPVTGKLIVVG